MLYPSSLTFGAAKDSELADIAGVCVTSADFRRKLNTAASRLMTYGNWWLTVVKGRICVYDNCIAWPRWTGTILATSLCNQNRAVMNKWFDFMPLSVADCRVNRYNRSNVTLVDDGITPVFKNIPCNQAFALQIHTRKQQDVGKTMTFYGIDENGQEMMSKDALGNWQKGVTIVTSIPDVVTTQKFQEVTRVTKEETFDVIDVYQVDDVNSVLLDMAHYEGTEIEPRYRHMTIRNGTTGGKLTSIEFLVKLEFVPVVNDSDIVQIDNITALKFMYQAIQLEEATDIDEANKFQAMAIKELNRVMNNKLPLNQIPISIDPFGSAQPYLAGVGRII